MGYAKRLVLLVVVVNLLVLFIGVRSLQVSYRQYGQMASTEVANLAEVLARDLGAKFDAVDKALLVVADAHENFSEEGKVDYRGLDRIVRRTLQRSPELMSIRVTDAQGEVMVGFEGDKPPPHSGVGEREYFIQQRDTPQAGLVISQPLVGKITGKWGIVFSRRLTHADGRFAGVVLAHMGLDRLRADFSSLEVGLHGDITLRDAQLAELVRMPRRDSEAPMGLGSLPVELAPAIQRHPTAGVYTSDHAAVDGIGRVHGYHQLTHHPYYVDVGVARSDFLPAWLHDFKVRALFFVLFSLMTGVGCWFLLKAWGQRERTLLALQKSEALTRTSEERFRLAMDANADGLWDWGGDNDAGYFSPAYFRMLGFEELAFAMDRTAWRELIHPEDRERVLAANQDCIQNRVEHFEVEFRMRKRDTSWCWVLSRGTAITRDEHGRAVRMLGTHQDITQRKQAEYALQAAQVEAARANNAKSRFLAAASHDLRQPLAALGLYLEVLRIKMQPPDEKLLANMDNCIDSLGGLLGDLLDISKLEAEVVVPEASSFPIADLLSRLVAEHRPQAQDKGLHLRLRPSAVVAHTDPVLLARMLGKLISNAVQYTERGGVLIACRRHHGKTWVEIWDTGIGIAPDQTQIIFEEYRQVEPNRPRSGGGSVGSGLGLAIVAKTAKLMGLEVRLQSRQGRGSLFALELPVA